MARNVATLKADIEAAYNTALAEDDPANRAAAISAVSQAIATAIDTYIGAIVTSVDSETLV